MKSLAGCSAQRYRSSRTDGAEKEKHQWRGGPGGPQCTQKVGEETVKGW